MFWMIVICLLLTFIPAFLIFQYFYFSKIYYRDKAFFAMNKLISEVFIKLSDHEFEDECSEPEAIKLENLYTVVNDMAENLSLFESKGYKFETLIEIYRRIIVDETIARQVSVTHLPEYISLKKRFSTALFNAFKINFFFRFRFTFFIVSRFIFPVFALNKRVAKKVHEAVATYKAVKAASNESVFLAC